MQATNVNSGRIRSIHKVLKSWIRIVDRYVDHFDSLDYTDVPWWYNENATTSTLAQATSKAGGVALQDYSSEKAKGKNSYVGKCDLYIGIGRQHFQCEAKQAWVNISRRAKTGYTKVESGLQRACDDARQHNKSEGRRLGICFAVPYLHERYQGTVDKQLSEWLSKIQKLERSSIAWVFPRNARSFKSEEGYFYPGVVLLAREV